VSAPEAWGRSLRAARKATGLSLRAVAEQAGVDFTYLSKIETGTFPPPSTRAIRHIAEVIGADADALIASSGKTDAHYSQQMRDRIAHLEAWLKRKLDAERDLLVVAEKASEVYLSYESCGDSDVFHARIGALGWALAEYAAKHKPATVADAEADEAVLSALVSGGPAQARPS
jgi:transcriptional regulator with XRE-family HTH domain